jgi:tetratricopeptide (TPR) repeat protein
MLRKPACFLAVFLLAGACGLAQAPSNQPRNRVEDYVIRGKIVIPNQHDFDQRIEVKLEKSGFQVIQTTYTDASGNFDFRNLGPGAYYISVTMEGYEPIHQLVEIFNTFGNSTVTIFLNRSAVEIRDKPFGLDAADPDVVDVSQMKENFPKKAVQNYEKAIEEKQKGRLENAIRLLEEAVHLAPTFFHAHNNLGILYQSVKRYPDAEREYNRSHQLNAKNERPLVNLGSLYIEESTLHKDDREAAGELLDKALDALEEAVKLNPRSAMGYFLLGQANYRSDFLQEAEAAFKKSHEIDPHMSAARLMLANVYVKLQKWEDVLENLDAYLKENPKAADRANVEQMRARIARNLHSSELPAAGGHQP